MLKQYKKLISLIICLAATILVTFAIKYYFKPFISMVIMLIFCNPIYKFIVKRGIGEKVSGAISIIMINIIFILMVLYLGNEFYNMIKRFYLSNLEWINEFLKEIALKLNMDFENFKMGQGVFSIINDRNVRQGAFTTGESIMAYFIGNISAFFILIDKQAIFETIKLIFPNDVLGKFEKHKENFSKMIGIEIILVLISTLEIIIGFSFLKVPNAFMLGIFCGILDILPYVGTIIVFIPIIIYNIVMRDYLYAIGLICLYLLIQIVREVLEAKFLSDKLEIHPLVILISIYIGMKIFGILGMVVGPMYSILAKEIIYSAE